MNSAQVRDLAVAALMNKTLAQARVYSPRDWPTRSSDYPVILLQTLFDEKKSRGRNAPQFNTTTTLRVSARLEAWDGETDDGAIKAEVQLEALQDQIVRALINSYELTRQIQQYSSVQSQIDINSSGESHTAQLLMDVAIEYFQGPDDFYPVDAVALEAIAIAVEMPDGTTRPQIIITPQE